MNGKPVADANQLRSKIGTMDPNVAVMLKVLRNGKMQEVAVTLGEFPSKEERASVDKGKLGHQSSGCCRRESYAGNGAGIEASGHDQRCGGGSSQPHQPRSGCWLTAGRCDPAGEPSIGASVKDYNQAVGASKKDEPVLLLVDRDGNTMFLAV